MFPLSAKVWKLLATNTADDYNNYIGETQCDSYKNDLEVIEVWN